MQRQKPPGLPNEKMMLLPAFRQREYILEHSVCYSLKERKADLLKVFLVNRGNVRVLKIAANFLFCNGSLAV